MKKVFLLPAFCMAVFSLSAQTKFGVTSGLVLASVSTNDEDLKSEKAVLLAPQLGVTVDHSISKQFSIQSQLLLIGKGTSIEHEGHKDKIRFMALDLPVQLVYRTKSGWFIGGGPNLGFNLSAKSIDEDGSESIDIGSAVGEVKGFDMGLNFRTGLELKNGLVLSVNKLFGLTNLQNVDGFRWNNNAIGLNVGYFFPKKSKK